MAFFEKRYHPPGTAPGTLTEVQGDDASPLQIRLIDFDKKQVTMRDDIEVSECCTYLENETITWIHVQGNPTKAALKELGKSFSLHSLVLEDILNTGQRPKIEYFDDQLFVIMNLPLVEDDTVNIQQTSFFLGKDYLISFCVGDFTPFEPIVKRLNDKASRLRSLGADFLLYSLLDVVIDQGFPLLEHFSIQLEELEEQVIESVDKSTLRKIHTIKRELISIRRMLWPQREVINQLQRGDHKLVHTDTLIYLRDCYDHTIQIMDLLESYRDMTASMLDIYLSNVSHKMNEVMRVLTVISTIFIPLTFIVGVYGMNFDRNAGPWSMPELGWSFGYPLIWLVMISLVGGMLVIFKRREWF
jgi:magnesium transporter